MRRGYGAFSSTPVAELAQAILIRSVDAVSEMELIFGSYPNASFPAIVGPMVLLLS